MDTGTNPRTTGMDAPAGDLHKADLRDKTKEIGGNLKEIGTLLRDVIEEKLDEWRDNAADVGRKGRDRANIARENVETYVTDEPIKSVLIAAGVGLLLGMFMSRR